MEHPLARECLSLDVALANVLRRERVDVGARRYWHARIYRPSMFKRSDIFQIQPFPTGIPPLNTTAMLYQRHIIDVSPAED
jgi:hypothetical protein